MTYKETRKIHAKVADYIRRHPEQTYGDMSSYLGISLPMLSKIGKAHGIHRKPEKSPADIQGLLAKLEK
jgi:hypothetical protein